MVPVLRSLSLALALASALFAGETDLVPNGGFESSHPDDPARPAGWTPHTDGRTAVAWSTDRPRTGKRCLEMSAQPDEKWGHAWWSSDPIPVRPCMAYRVRFHFRSRGWGVPVFDLAKVKEWRLYKSDTKGEWMAHEDVVVVPPNVTSTVFNVHNYHRPGKTMWFDDVSMVELPLAESPLTKRLDRVGRNVAGLRRRTDRLKLTLEQEEALAGLGKQFEAVRAAYKELEAGTAATADFGALGQGLDALESALGAWLVTVWAGETGPETVVREATLTLEVERGKTVTAVLGVLALIDEPIAARAVAAPDRGLRGCRVRLLVTTAHPPKGERPWGDVNSLGEVLLPPGVPRHLKLEATPDPKTKPGRYPIPVRIEALDRVMAPAVVTVELAVR